MTVVSTQKHDGEGTERKGTAALRSLFPAYFGWDPFRSMDAWRETFEAREPALNLYEKDGAYVIECAVPGYKKDEIKVEARDNAIVVSGTSSSRKSEEKNNYYYREVRQGAFRRVVELPKEVDSDKVDAKLEQGMLTVTVHPKKAIEHKAIPISGP